MLTKSGFAKRAADKLILPKTGTQAAGGEFFNTIRAGAVRTAGSRGYGATKCAELFEGIRFAKH